MQMITETRSGSSWPWLIIETGDSWWSSDRSAPGSETCPLLSLHGLSAVGQELASEGLAERPPSIAWVTPGRLSWQLPTALHQSENKADSERARVRCRPNTLKSKKLGFRIFCKPRGSLGMLAEPRPIPARCGRLCSYRAVLRAIGAGFDRAGLRRR